MVELCRRGGCLMLCDVKKVLTLAPRIGRHDDSSLVVSSLSSLLGWNVAICLSCLSRSYWKVVNVGRRRRLHSLFTA